MPTLVPGFVPPVPQVKDENTSNRASVSTYARYFDGVNDYIAQDTYGANVGGIGDFSISVSFYPLSVANYRNVFDMNFGYFTNPNTGVRLEMDSTGRLACIYSSATSNSGSQYTSREIFTPSDPLRPNQWYHITITRTGTTVKFYVNGYEKSTVIGQNNDPNGLDSFPGAFQAVTIGKGFSADSGRHFYGYISNFKIFDTALTASQALENFQRPSQGVPTGVSKQRLRLWWKLSEGDGYVAYDSSFSVGTTNIARNSTVDQACQIWELADSTDVTITNNRLMVTNPSSTRSIKQSVSEMVSGRWYRIKMDVTGDLNFLIQIGNGAGGYYNSTPSNGTEYYDFRCLGGSFLQILTYSGTGKNTYDNIEIYEMSPEVPGFVSGSTANYISGTNNSQLPALPLESYNVSSNSLTYSQDFNNMTVNGGTLTSVPTGLRPDGRLGYYALNGQAYFGIGGNNTRYYYIILKKNISSDTAIYVNGTSPTEVIFNFDSGTITSGTNYADPYIKLLGDGWYYVSFASTQTTHYSYWANIASNRGALIAGMGQAASLQSHGYLRTYGYNIGGHIAIPEGMEDGKDALGMPFMHPRKPNSFNFLKSGLAIIQAQNQPTGNEARTLEAWIYFVSDGGSQSFIELGSGSVNNSRFGIIAISDYIYIVGQANDHPTGIAYTNKAWNHIVATHDGSTLKVYKNGSLVSSAGKTYSTTNIGIRVGNNSRNDEPAASIVMNPKVYDFALTAEQVQSAYNGNATTVGSTQAASELQAYISRTNSAGATVESHSCLLSLLNELDEM